MVASPRLSSLLRLLTAAVLIFVLSLEARTHAQAQPAGPGDQQPRAKAKNAGRTFPITIAGKAIDEGGNPIKGATLILASTNRSPSRKLAQTTTDDNGQYEFRDVPVPEARLVTPPPRGGFSPREPFEGADFQIIGSAPKFAIHLPHYYSVTANPRLGEFPLGEKIDLNLTFQPAARVWGRILAEDGKSVSGAELRISIVPVTGRGRDAATAFFLPQIMSYLSPDPFRTKTNESGEFEFASVPPEMLCTLSVNHADYGSTSLVTSTAAFPPEQSGRSAVAKLPVELKLRTARLVTVAVQAASDGQPLAGAPVSASGASAEGANSARGMADKEGMLMLKLPPGSYRLRGEGPAGKDFVPSTQDLVVDESPAEQSTTLKINQGATLLLKAIDAETGKGIAGVSFWHEPVNAPAGLRGFLGVVRTDVQATPQLGGFNPMDRTNAEGEFRAVVVPGPSRCGVGSYGAGFRTAGRSRPPTLPEGYQALDSADLETGREIETNAGRSLTLEFKLLKVN